MAHPRRFEPLTFAFGGAGSTTQAFVTKATHSCWASAYTAISRGSPVPLPAPSRRPLRSARIVNSPAPVIAMSFLSAASDKRPDPDGDRKMNAVPRLGPGSRVLSKARAAPLKGGWCGRRAFMRSAVVFQTPCVRSTSSHDAPRASPDRAVRRMNRRQWDASVCHTTSVSM